MGIFKRIFGKRMRPNLDGLPCASSQCPYEYDQESDRDIEGMPFVECDPRSCPHYGHICPEFMEAFGLSVEDLDLRATIHCGALVENLIADGQADPATPEVQMLRERLAQVRREYPEAEFPRLYAPSLPSRD